MGRREHPEYYLSHPLLSKNRDGLTDISAAGCTALYSCLIFSVSLCFTIFVLLNAPGQTELHKCIDELCGIPYDSAEQLSTTIIELQSPKAAASFNRMA